MDTQPYCGTPPVPQDWLTRWNADPILLLCAGLVALLLVMCMRGASPGRKAAVWGGYSVAVFSFVSPLCALSMALFSARTGQHLLLVLVAAPLIAYGNPFRAQRASGASALIVSSAVFAALLWLWHFPVPYAATLASHGLYWAMHLSLLVSALALWHCLLHAQAQDFTVAVLAALGTTVQMGLLSGLLFFTQNPWHDWHLSTTWPWGLTAAEDQALAALLMWVPGSAIFAGVTFFLIAKWLAPMLSDAASLSRA